MTRNRFTCEKCCKSYATKSTLNRHLNWECGRLPSFGCKICTYKCKQRFNMIVHLDSKHGKTAFDQFGDLNFFSN